MGREVKRVAMDFNWPLSKVWYGYLNPHYAQCQACDGSGSTLAAQRLNELVHLLMLSGSDAATRRAHPYFDRESLFHYTQRRVLGKDMVELTTALAGRPPSLYGHDGSDVWAACHKITDAAGLPKSWGVCPECRGEGIPIAAQEAYEAWTPTEPPEGPGYQIWETVSEGSPISPVFATPEELAAYMAGSKWGADKGTSYETWLKFITGPGWAPSFVSDEHGLRSGVEAVVDQKEGGS